MPGSPLEVFEQGLTHVKNLIQFKNLKGLGNFSTNTNYELEFYPASEIRNLGFTGGTFNVKYNFFRKLAGEDRAVLVRTKAGVEGDIVPNDAQIHITENGKVFFSDEESYLSNPKRVDQLAIEDLKYRIDEISPLSLTKTTFSSFLISSLIASLIDCLKDLILIIFNI